MGMESEPTEEWVLLLSWVGEVKENCRVPSGWKSSAAIRQRKRKNSPVEAGMRGGPAWLGPYALGPAVIRAQWPLGLVFKHPVAAQSCSEPHQAEVCSTESGRLGVHSGPILSRPLAVLTELRPQVTEKQPSQILAPVFSS